MYLYRNFNPVYTQDRFDKLKNTIIFSIDGPYSVVNTEKRAIDPENDAALPMVKDDIIFVPLKFLAANIGVIRYNIDENKRYAQIEYSPDHKIEVIHIINVEVGRRSIIKNGDLITVDSDIIFAKGGIYVSIGTLAIIFGRKVFHIDKLVIISVQDLFFDSIKDIDLIEVLKNETKSSSGLNYAVIKNPLIEPYYGQADPKTLIPDNVKPLVDVWMRDTYICNCEDGYYYLTGTTRFEGINFPIRNNGIHIWRSKNLKNWDDLGYVWTFDKDAAWQKQIQYQYDANGNRIGHVGQRHLYAPEIHYIKGNYYITACMCWPGGVTFLLKSSSGKIEGPYINSTEVEGPLTTKIDSSLFCDDDGCVYYVFQNGMIAKMKDDMSGLAEEPVMTIQEPWSYEPAPYREGAFLFKYKNKYHLALSVFIMYKDGQPQKYGYYGDGKKKISYNCVIASSDNVYGPYINRYTAITGGGHNNIFVDKKGNWWSTMFGNPTEFTVTPFYARPAIIPMRWDERMRLYPIQSRELENI